MMDGWKEEDETSPRSQMYSIECFSVIYAWLVGRQVVLAGGEGGKAGEGSFVGRMAVVDEG